MNLLDRIRGLVGATDPQVDAVFEELLLKGLADASQDDTTRLGLRTRADDMVTLRRPNAAEEVWLAKRLADALRILGRPPGEGRAVFEPPALDAAYLAWEEAPWQSRESEVDLVAALGASFGQGLVERHGMDWAMMPTSQGEDFATRHAGRLVVLPMEIAARRLRSRRGDFFARMAGLIDETLEGGGAPERH